MRGLQAHGIAVAARRQFALDRAQQVVDLLLLDEQVAVARHAELVAAAHAACRANSRDTKASTIVPRNTKWRLPNSSGSRIRRGSERGACTTARPLLRPKPSSPSTTTAKFRLLLRIFGNGRAGIERERAQHRLDLAHEIVARARRPAPRVQVSGARNTTPCCASSGRSTSLSSGIVHRPDACVARADRLQLSGTDRPSGRRLDGTGFQQFLEPRHADLEEFVEIRAARCTGT